MIKFFLTLYFTFFGGLIFTFIIVFSLVDVIIQSSQPPTLIDRIFTGTFRSLNHSIENLNPVQVKQKITEYKQHFPSLFDLLEISSIGFSEDQLKRLDQNKLVSIEETDKNKVKQADEGDSVTLYYYKRPHSSQVWQSNSDFDLNINNMNVTVTGGQMIKGMFFIAEQIFDRNNTSQWSQNVNEIQALQNFPVQLLTLEKLNISEEDFVNISKGDVVNINQGARLVIFAHRIKNTAPYVLQFEIAEVPWFIYYIVYIALLLIVLVVAVPTFIWAWPLWRNLSQLKLAAEQFGLGEYQVRVPYSKYSRLAELSHAFNAMAERTQHSIDSHKELTSAVSHELRTPVARMRFSLEMLSTSDDKQDIQRYTEDINGDIEELDLLLSELLTYARFDQNSGNMTFQSQNIKQWMRSSMKRLQPLANTIQLDYKIHHIKNDESALFEPRLMSRVLDNLVQNALRYAKTKVQVSLSKEGQYYLLCVEDDGQGIAKKERKKLFDAFFRIDSSRDRRSGGFGLGLAIAKRVVEGHKGEIKVDDSPLGGARFKVKWLM